MFVAYYRVSTDKQGQSGLGLEAQQEAVRSFIHGEPEREFIEVESGAKNDRLQLAIALAESKKTGSTLIVAKLDRLARDVKLILSIVDSGVSVRFVDLPDIDTSTPVGRLMLTMMASFAEFERRMISKRTKEALKAKKARGGQLGSRDIKKVCQASIRARADKIKSFDQVVMPIICDLQRKGFSSSRAIADQLTLKQVRTRKGGTRWGHSQVCEILRRAA